MVDGWTIVLALLSLLLVWGVFHALFLRVTVLEYQRALRYRQGHFVGVDGPGQYWIYRPHTTVQHVDMRLRAETVSGQEVLSADGLPLKVSLAASYRVADPERAINTVEDYSEALHIALQLALRQLIGAHPMDELLEQRGEFGAALMELAAPAVAALGLELVSADVRDIMLPGEIKKVYAQVVKARKEGLAALELARGETAALRSLANVAKTVQDHPWLLQLRALQRLSEAGGHTVVLGLTPDGAASLMGRGGPAAPPQAGPEPQSE